MAHQTNFANGKVWRSIVDVSLPITAAQLLNLLYNIVDRIYIGHIPKVGDIALTGVGLSFPIITLIMAFSMLFGSNGGAPLCSMERGKGNDEEAEKIMGTSFFMLVCSGAVITVLGLIFAKPILYLFGASDASFPYAYSYLTIYLLGSVFVMVTLGMNSFINSQGFGRTGMMTVVIGAVLNIILDPLFIFVFDLGVQGAAIATVLSQLVSGIWVIRFLTGPQAVLKLKFKSMRLQAKRLKDITVLGFSGFIMGLTSSLVQIVCNKMAFLYGGDLYVTVMTVLNSVRELFSTPLSGFSGGAVPVISYNYGAKQFGRVKQAIRFMVIFGLVSSSLVWLLVVCFPAAFIHLFNSEPALIEAGVPAIRTYFFGFVLMSLHMNGQNTFVALGKAKQAITFSLLRKVIIVVPLTLLLPGLGFGVEGVLLAEPISNIVSGIACFTTMYFVVFGELNGKRTPKVKHPAP